MYMHIKLTTKMNRILTLVLALLVSVLGFAQSPEGINYQAVITNNSGSALANQSVTMRTGIYSGVNGTIKEYEETHVLTTSDNGHVSLVIGQGSVLSGTFGNISWGDSRHFLKVEVDKGEGYINMGLVQLQSVPYSLYSKTAGEVENLPTMELNDMSDVDAVSPSSNAVLKYDGSKWVSGTDETGSTYTAGSGININSNEINALNNDPIWNATKLNGRSVSNSTPNSGDILKWDGSAWGISSDDVNTYNAGSGLTLNSGTFSANTNDPLWNASKLKGNDISSKNPSSGEVLKWNGTNWAPSTDDNDKYTAGNGIAINSGAIDATNSSAMWNADKLQGRGVSNVTPATGEVLEYDGTNWTPRAKNSYSAGTGISIASGTISAQNTTDMWNADKLRGRGVSTTSPSSGEVLKWNGTTWAPAADNGASYSAGTGISIASNAINATNGTAMWNADKIQGRAASTSTPNNGDVLKWSGSAWAPATDNGASYSAGTGITISSNTIAASNGSAIWNAEKLQGRSMSSTAPTTGQVLKWNGSAWTPAKDSSGGGSSSSVWSKSGNNIYSGTNDNVGINRTNPTSRLHVWDSITSGSGVNLLADYRLYPSPSSSAGGWVLRTVGDINSSAEIIGMMGITTGSSSVTGASGYGLLSIAGSVADNAYGVYSLAEDANIRTYALQAVSDGTGTFNIGGFFIADRNSSNSNYGVYAIADSASTAVAGYFDGDVTYTGTLTGPSDQFLKKDISNMPTALGSIMSLNPKTYYFKADDSPLNLPEGKQFGFIAQELEEVFPELIHEQKHIDNPREKKGAVETTTYKSVDYMSLIPVLTKAIQEQQEMIDELKKEVEILKSQK